MELFKTKKSFDILVLILLPILAAVLTSVSKLNLISYTLLFLGLPAVYLSLRNPTLIKKSLLCALTALPILMAVDYLATINKTWYIPNSILNYRLFGIITLEVTVWWFLWVYFAIIFYEYFLDYDKNKYKISKNIKYILTATPVIIIAVLVCLLINPAFLNIQYFYIKFGLILIIIPLTSFLSVFPKFISKFLKASAYFFGFSLLHEVIALQNNHWKFPGSELFGNIKLLNTQFPFEEFLFFMVIGVAGLLSYYEFFADDKT